MDRQSWATNPAVRRSMRRNKSRDTAPELRVRRLVHAMGLRYRVNVPPVPGLRRSADIVFPRQRVAIFIDGCFWHGCPEHYTAPKANAGYWREKVERNRVRDEETTQRVTGTGWRVLRFWAHEDPVAVAGAIVETVRSDRGQPGSAAEASRVPASAP